MRKFFELPFRLSIESCSKSFARSHSDSACGTDAPGALIEYYPVSLSDPNFSPEDCKPYGFLGSGVQLCIKSEGNNSFVAGFLNLLKSG